MSDNFLHDLTLMCNGSAVFISEKYYSFELLIRSISQMLHLLRKSHGSNGVLCSFGSMKLFRSTLSVLGLTTEPNSQQPHHSSSLPPDTSSSMRGATMTWQNCPYGFSGFYPLYHEKLSPRGKPSGEVIIRAASEVIAHRLGSLLSTQQQRIAHLIGWHPIMSDNPWTGVSYPHPRNLYHSCISSSVVPLSFNDFAPG